MIEQIPKGAKRRLIKIEVNFISHVKEGATGEVVIIKSADTTNNNWIIKVPIEKIDEERRVVYGIVYAPNEVDSHGDYADEETIRDACYNFMKSGRIQNIDQQHSGEPVPAFVAENWIVRPGDSLFPDKVGAWAQGHKIEDPEYFKKFKTGELKAFSISGTAEVIELEKANLDLDTIPLEEDAPWDWDWARDGNAIIEKYGWKGLAAVCLYVDREYETENKEDGLPAVKEAYYFPVAKIKEGKLKLFWRGLVAARVRVQQSNLPRETKEEVLDKIKHLYKRFDADFEKSEGIIKWLAKALGLIKKDSAPDQPEPMPETLKEYINEEQTDKRVQEIIWSYLTLVRHLVLERPADWQIKLDSFTDEFKRLIQESTGQEVTKMTEINELVSSITEIKEEIKQIKEKVAEIEKAKEVAQQAPPEPAVNPEIQQTVADLSKLVDMLAAETKNINERLTGIEKIRQQSRQIEDTEITKENTKKSVFTGLLFPRQ